MPEYLAPGVYIEEVSYRAKGIEGVSTSTAGFVGPARFGPITGEPELLTSFADFERIFGGLDQLIFEDAGTPQPPSHNFLAHGVRAFFEEGGKRLYVSRIYNGSGGAASTDNQSITPTPTNTITLTARFPGQGGNMRVTLIPSLSDNLLVQDPTVNQPQIRRIQEHDTVLLTTDGAPPTTVVYDVARSGDNLLLQLPDATQVQISTLNPAAQTVQLLTVSVAIERPISRPKRPKERYGIAEVLGGFSFHPQHANALSNYFTNSLNSRRLSLTVPFALSGPAGVDTGAEWAEALLGTAVFTALTSDTATQAEKQQVYLFTGGSDGELPAASDYEGAEANSLKSGLLAFEDLEDISIVAAPGYSHDYNSDVSRADAIQAYLINHCHKMRYRVAVLDSSNNHALSEVRAARSKFDSTHAAFYYPWVRVLDPVTEEEIHLPGSGFMAGIYARNDVENGVHKAPANEVVRLAIGFEFMLNKGQQEALNPDGVNCFRFFEGRGYRVWGARTISSDPEWRYISVRRYFAYLERSIERGTQWAVFENNNEALWGNIRRTIEDFMFNEWKSGRLMGEKPEEAYFVRCDRSTMTQNDLDNGRLICLIGVAPVKPAEFVIFRIGQWTADRRS